MTRFRHDGAAGADRGSVTLELVILAPALILLLSAAVVAGRISITSQGIETATAMAARSASLARTPQAAREAASEVAGAALRAEGMECRSLDVSVDVSGFAPTAVRAGSVTVNVTCTVPLSDLAAPGLPGKRTITAAATSVVDEYRSS